MDFLERRRGRDDWMNGRECFAVLENRASYSLLDLDHWHQSWNEFFSVHNDLGLEGMTNAKQRQNEMFS